MKQWKLLVGILIVCAGCGSKEMPLPDAHPVPPSTPEDLAAFQAPSVYVPPQVPTPQPVSPTRPPAANEKRYAWEDGKADRIQVQLGYPTVVRFEPGERITAVMDGDRDALASAAETEAGPRPPQAPPTKDAPPHCYYGVRWQWCRGIAASTYTPIEHLVFTATQVGQRQGVVVFTDRRQYTLELHAVRATQTRLVSWSYPAPPLLPAPPPAPGLFPAARAIQDYHVGYRITTLGPTPEWIPLQVVSDLPTVPSAKIYIRFPPVVLHQRMPLLRGMTEDGTPYLLNARQYGEWVVVDELAPRLELRRGAGAEAARVVITRDRLHSLRCPGDAQCPQFPH